MKNYEPTAAFETLYDTHLKHLQLQGLREQTVDAYSRAVDKLF